MVRSIQYFKDRFQVGYEITQQDYYDWLDSFIHAATGITVANISDLSQTLANYRLKNVNIPASEIDGLSAAISNLTQNFLTTSSTINQSQIIGLVDALTNCTTVQQVQNMINTALDTFEFNNTPSIGQNGNWFIGPNDTGVPAQGQDGQDGLSAYIGPNGNWWVGDTSTTPPTGTDTGISASGGASNFQLLFQHPAEDVFNFVLQYQNAQGNTVTTYFNMRPAFDMYLDYAWQTDNGSNIIGPIDGVNRSFYASKPFREKTIMVFRDGRKMRKGSDKDFVVAVDSSGGTPVNYVKFNYDVPVDSALEFVYPVATF